MRWKAKKNDQWNEWYAWHPVTVDGGDKVLFEKIYRKQIEYPNGKKKWIYKDTFDMIKGESQKEAYDSADEASGPIPGGTFQGGSGGGGMNLPTVMQNKVPSPYMPMRKRMK